MRSIRVTPRAALAGACAAAVFVVPAQFASATATTSGAPVPPGGVALTWAPTFMADDHSYTQAEAVALAKKHDLVAGMPVSFRNYVSAMRTANPKVTIATYANATFTTKGEASGLPESYFAHTTSGARITSQAFGNYLMEPSSAGWRSTATAQCKNRATAANYDGCIVDMLTMGIFSANYVSALPRVPGTSTEYTQTQWRDQLERLGGQYHTDYPGLVTVGNSVSNSYRYWQSPVPSRPIAQALPSALMEDFLRGGGDAVTKYPAESDWLRNVQVITDLESTGHTGLFITKLWCTHTAAQVASWQRYTMATFLMGANGHSYLAFTDARSKVAAAGDDLPYSMPKSIGLPSGAMSKVGGVYRRNFVNGMSLVNPTTSAVTVSLGGSYRTLEGTTVSSLTLPANSGEVLVKSTTTSTTTTDTTAPTAGFNKPAAGSTVPSGSVQIAGWSKDNRAIAKSWVAVQNRITGRWLQPNGTFTTTYARVPVNLAAAGTTSSWWGKWLPLPTGSYTATVIVQDGAGNLNPTPRPARSFTTL